MKKDISILKKAKISKAQQYMLLTVFGTGIVIGAAIAVVSHCIRLIGFNARVISAKDQAIVTYSDTIKNAGVCKSPRGTVYALDELKNCDPNTISTSEVPGTLRSNILNNLASNESLSFVSSMGDDSCLNPETGKTYTYKELNTNYNNAKTEEEISSATNLIKRCSALRLIPDALPSHKNEEALLASLNKIFNISGWTPETISPGGFYGDTSIVSGVMPLSVNLEIRSDAETAYVLLDNIEHSMREFDIKQATIESSGAVLEMSIRAEAYWVEPTKLNEVTEVVLVDEKGKK